ncbi:MAG: peptidoglycan DD-metalloendopeptidase family protein [Vallitalea sp.]|jgi:hypothetical protein|nr:peptidoglycan DD-metalloendopeptidase family protein [Vallitalea sp.]
MRKIFKTVFLLLFFLIFLPNNIAFAMENNFSFPLKSKYVITSEFGERIHPITKKKSFHYGIDLACPSGTNVYTATTGTVKEIVINHSVYGNMVVVESFSSEHYIVYAHLRDIGVLENQAVTGGKTLIGHVGSTGMSTGPHLHFEVRLIDDDGKLICRKNPRDFLSFNSTSNIDEVGQATGEPTTGEGANKALVYGLKLFCMSHITGQIDLHIQGGYPKFDIYKSFNRKDWTFMGSSNTNLYTEHGLDNNQTVYYKVIDNYGKYSISRYTPITINKQLYPLKVVQISDDKVHVNWDTVDFWQVDLYLDNSKILNDFNGTGYTINNLAPNTTYTLYAKNPYDHRSNTITFTTTDKLDKIEKLLTKLLKPDLTDSNSDGMPDIVEPLDNAVKDAIKKLTGGAHEEVTKTIEELLNDTDFNEDIGDEFKIETNWQGIKLVIMDLNREDLKAFIKPIRAILLAILTVSFVLFIINLFDVQFKV